MDSEPKTSQGASSFNPSCKAAVKRELDSLIGSAEYESTRLDENGSVALARNVLQEVSR